MGLKTVVLACFPGLFPPRGRETRTLCLSPPPLECFPAVRGVLSEKRRVLSTALGASKPQNLFSGAILIGNTQGIGGAPGGHSPRRPAAVPGPKCEKVRKVRKVRKSEKVRLSKYTFQVYFSSILSKYTFQVYFSSILVYGISDALRFQRRVQNELCSSIERAMEISNSLCIHSILG